MSLRRALRLRSEVERLASLTHRDAASFDADGRDGSVLLDAGGRVICERVPVPPQLSRRSSLSRSITPWSDAERLPDGHPRLRESRDRSKALRLADWLTVHRR